MSLLSGRLRADERTARPHARHRLSATARRGLSKHATLTYAIVLAVGIVIAIARPGIWFVLVTLLLGAALAHLSGWRNRNLRIVALALAATVAAIDYLAWRFTVVSWSSWYIGAPLLLAEVHAALHAVGLQLSMWPRRERQPAKIIDTSTLPIFVFVPTVDEDVGILGPTLSGVLGAKTRYLKDNPLAQVEVIVCNDGGVAGAACSDAVIALSDRLGVTCVTRTVGGGAKAGNVEHARRLVGAFDSALLVIFDADQIPNDDFLLATVPPFSDPTIGWVQTGQFYRNRENPVSRWADDQQSLFYRLLCPLKSARNAVFICGTNVVIKAAALDEIGGFPQDCVTEDFAASVLLAPRWRSMYLPGVFATGVGPMDLRAYLKQQERWARGTLAVLRSDWSLLLKPSSRLTASQRLQYGLAMTHYLAGVRDLVFFIAPLLFIVAGISGVEGATAADFLKHFVPYFAITSIAFWHVAARTTSWRSIAIGFASSPAMLKATWMTAFGRFGQFNVTPKSRASVSWWRAGRVYIIGLAICLISLAIAATLRRGPAVLLASLWTAYLAVMFSSSLAIVIADVRYGRKVALHGEGAEVVLLRSETSGRLRPRKPGPGRLIVALRILPVALGAAMCVVLVSALIPDTPRVIAGPAPTYAPGHPRVGMSGADEARILAISKQLNVNGSISGRTIEIADSFDRNWADGASQGGGVPWVTLTFSKNGRRTLSSSLTAIVNGVHDGSLVRWAKDVAAFGKPVYLTVLPQVDKDYSASSAVDHGGIPADAPRAWNHIRDVFASSGATNVAWVWYPGDATSDARFLPSPTSMDAIAVSWYSYANTEWVDPTPMLDAVSTHHPDLPMLLEISADGTPCAGITTGSLTSRICEGARIDQDEWLNAVASAVHVRRDVAGVVYHDGGPFIDPEDRRAAEWRLRTPQLWGQLMIAEA